VSDDEFGQAIALGANIVAVGAPFHTTTVTSGTQPTTTFTNAGASYIFSLTSIPTSCESKTDYATAQCAGTFSVGSLSDLEQYVAQDYGRQTNKGKYQNLSITAGLTDSPLIIQSPCTITFTNRVQLQGDFVSIDGRGGVSGKNGYEINAQKVCILSLNGSAEFGNTSFAQVTDLTIQAAKNATIGKNASITMSGDLVIKSTGTAKSSQALLDASTVVTAGSIRLE